MTDLLAQSPVETQSEAPASVRGPWRSRRLPSVAACLLLVLMAFSVFAQFGALRRDLPLPDADEDFFVRPAVHMAATGDLNPHWFGHPGSTVIYPVAALIHVWDAVLHHGPIFGSNPLLEHRLAENPDPFYIIARLWVIALAVATIPVLFALGRRAFNQRVGLIAAVLWAVLPAAIHADRIVRTESAATFFGLVALYWCVRAWQDPRRRWCVYAGLSVGLAVSSRYFMATLGPPLLAAAALPVRGDRRRAVFAAATALVAMVIGFVLTTPYALFDLSTARHDLNSEATLSHKVAAGLSPLGNASWYVRDAIPGALTWPLYIAALLGLILIVRQRRAYQLMLVAFCGIFFVAICASKLHWQRWTIEMLPLLLLFAAVAVQKTTNILAARVPVTMHASVVGPVVVTLALAIVPLIDIPKTNRYDAAATTSRLAREWMQKNIQPGSRVLQLPNTFNIPTRSIAPIGHGIEINYGLDATKSLSYYRHAGVGYVAVLAGTPGFYMLEPNQNPTEAAFYTALACKTRLVASFPRSNARFGLGISIYRLDQAPVKLLDLFCAQRAVAQP